MRSSSLFFNHFMCFISLFVGIIIPAHANESPAELINKYSVELLTAEDGFSSSEIYSIIQDNQGLLWFGTAENGIMRYDGRKVTLFEFGSSNANGLSHNDAGNLMLDHHGRIWIGTWGGGVNLYQPKTGRFENFTKEPLRNDSLASNRIQSLFHDQEGTIWLGSYDNGLSRYLGNNSFERINKSDALTSSLSGSHLSNNRIWDIEDNDQDSLWLATSFGLNLYNKKAQNFTYFFPEPENHTPTGANEIRSILKTSTNKLYVGTQVGPFSFDKEKGLFTALKTLDDEYLGQVNSMIEDHEGDIWIVSSKGLFRQSNSSTHIERFALEHSNGLRIIFEDSSKTIWVTNENYGIYKIVPHRKFKSINSSVLMPPNAITVDAQGDLLIVSAAAQLYKWHVSSQTLETLSSAIFSKENGSIERPIIFLDSQDILWIAQDDGLAKFNLKTKQVTFVKYPQSDPNHDEFREIRALNTDQSGKLWIGTYKNGIYRYDTSAKTFEHLDDSSGLSHPEIFEIFTDRRQNIWVGTGNGLNLWDDSKQVFFTFKGDDNQAGSLLGKTIQDIHQSRDGKIWIATQKGLNLYQPETKSFKHFTQEDGLATSLIRAIEEDKIGNLWLTTNKGISKLNPLSGVITNFDSYDGLLGLNYYTNSLVRGAHNTIFASSQRGVEFFNTVNIKTSNSEFNVVLTGFNKMGQSIPLKKPYSYVTDIQLSYLDYFFSFEFSVLDFISPKKNRYAYKLEGYDDNWIDIGNRNIVSFTNLDGGAYNFLVKATNSNGKWGTKLLSINLYIAPPPWKTWWAYSLYLLIAALIILAIIQFRTRLQQTEIARQKQFVFSLEELVAEKTASLKTQARDLLAVNKQLEVLTYKDGLTGLYNRRYFDQELTLELNRHYRQQQPLSLIICDIDHFKLYNDTYGHLQGDDCIKRVAQCICASVGRVSDANCRYGGEEFAIILPNTSIEQASLVAERLCLAVENMQLPHKTSETSASVTLTLGVSSVVPRRETSVDSMVLSADKALYLGKSQGRNRVVRSA